MQQEQPPGAPSPGPDKLFYGWWIVIIGCIQDAVKGGTFNTGFTLYFLPILTELHLSRAATSLPFSLAKLESAVEGPLVGYLIDRFDPRMMLVLGTILAGLGFILLAFTHSYLFFVLVFMGLLTLGFQAGFNHATMAAVNHWFLKKRGLAMAIVQTGQAIGGVVLFPLVALAVLKLGWRYAAILLGVWSVSCCSPWSCWSAARRRAWGCYQTVKPASRSIRPPSLSGRPHLRVRQRSIPPKKHYGRRPSGCWPLSMACAIFPIRWGLGAPGATAGLEGVG